MLTFDKTVFQQGAFRLQVDLSIPPGGVTALIGPSGAGKSTLLHGIAGFVPQPEGDVRWADASLTGLAPEERPVSMLFQDNNLFPHLTAIQNVALALAPRLWPSLADRKTAEAMLARVGLGDLSDRKPGALSGGQQSRVALARALLQDRPILLLDEPFGALGPKLKAEMLDLTVQLAEGRTLIMVTHDPDDAQRIADDVIGVVEGRAMPPQKSEAFLASPPEPLSNYFDTL